MPTCTILFDAYRLRWLARECQDRPFPKISRRLIRVHHANFPAPRKTLPNLVRYLRPNSPPPVPPDDEELRHIPNRRIARSRRTAFHQNQSCQFSADPHEKGMPVRLTPIKGKLLIAKPAVLS